jgi:catechol 2,3-dioxygenase-like lactoylglutathione lyase family enzyme
MNAMISHPGIVVPDLEQAREFYVRMFGFTVHAEESWEPPNEEYDTGTGLTNSAARGYILSGVNCFLELWQYSSPRSAGNPSARGANDYGFRHLAFEVDDVHAEVERWCRLGGQLMNQPAKNPRGRNAIYVRDPFGNIIELMESGDVFPSLESLRARQDGR